MGLRFQRRVRLFPGVRLNFSLSGVSTTIGVRGASVTLGRGRAHGNLGIPGTGISYRAPLNNLSGRSPAGAPSAVPGDFGAGGFSSPSIPIQSEHASQLTSTGLEPLKHLINEVSERRSRLAGVVAKDRAALKKARVHFGFARSFIVRIFTTNSIARLSHAVDDAEHQLAGNQELLEGCTVEIDFGLDDGAASSYPALAKAFDDLASCQSIWDVTGTKSPDRIRERTSAMQAITRVPVTFSRAGPGIVHAPEPILQLGNDKGRDLFVLAGFLMMKEPDGDFALLEFRDVSLEASWTNFQEVETVPTDTEVVGETWQKANKDGSRDRRFNDNSPIPIVRYGELNFRSEDGLNEAYMASSFPKVQAFARAFELHAEKLAQSRASGHELDSAVPAADTEDELAPPPVSYRPVPPRPNLIWDWIGLVALVFVVGYGATSLPALMNSAPAPVPAPATVVAPDPPPAPVAPPAPKPRKHRLHATNAAKPKVEAD